MPGNGVVRRIRIVLVWVMTAYLALTFGGAGVAKFVPASPWTAEFRHWGFPDWFRLGIGTIEVLLAICLLVPRMARYAAAAAVFIMMGAIATKTVHHEVTRLEQELVPAALAVAVIVARRGDKRLWNNPEDASVVTSMLPSSPSAPAHPE
jgi:uncharacterized membrane protein YphA (DoxX/SURF4 family)